jgi:hypothetical protein
MNHETHHEWMNEIVPKLTAKSEQLFTFLFTRTGPSPWNKMIISKQAIFLKSSHQHGKGRTAQQAPLRHSGFSKHVP